MLIAYIGDANAIVGYIRGTSVSKWQASPLLHLSLLRFLH